MSAQKNTRPLIVAIDGPSGAGKSTLGKALARRLGLLYIDSGAVYRAVGCAAVDREVALENSDAVAEIARSADIKLTGDPFQLKVTVDGVDVTERIRRPDGSRAASIVATYPRVREAVVDKLRNMANDSGVVMDGRDIGTKVFPDADVKLFLDAGTEARSMRRWEEEKERGRNSTLETVKSDIEERDRRDTEREATPLIQAPDAVRIDTSNLSVEGVVDLALEIIAKRQ